MTPEDAALTVFLNWAGNPDKRDEVLAGVLLKEARPQGVRVSAVYPGGTDTTFRAVRRPDYMSPDSVAEAVYAVLTLPEDLTVHSMTFRPWVETNF